MDSLLAKDGAINLVYSVNEPAAAGASAALQARGKEKDVLIVTVDGGCLGVKNVDAGVIGATAQQYPLKMASLGVNAISEFARTGKKPAASPGLDLFNTGVTLIAKTAVAGVESKDVRFGLDNCWG